MLATIKRYGKKPFSIGSLSNEQMLYILSSKKLNCGINKFKWLFSVQNFFFSQIVDVACRLHDIYYERGGNLWDKFKGDFYFLKYMIIQITKVTFNFIFSSKAIVNFILDLILGILLLAALLICTIVYFVAVFFLGFLSFKYGPYKDWDEIRKLI